MFNLYCYQLYESGAWSLRGYVPVNFYEHPDTSDQKLKCSTDNQYLTVRFGDAVIFTGKLKSGADSRSLDKANVGKQ